MAVRSLPGGWASVARYLSIVKALSLREIETRYKATALGLVWYLVANLFMIALYSVVFSSIFKGRWAQPALAGIDFTALMFTGLVFFNAMNEVLGRAPGVFVSQSSIVKRMVFPVFLLPLVPVVVAMFNALIAGTILIAYCIYADVTLHITGFAIFVVIVPFVIMMVALSYILAASAVYIRDIIHVTALLGAALMFLSSLFYAPDILPPPMNWIAGLNPVNYPIDEARRLLLVGDTPDLGRFVTSMGTSCLMLLVGLWWYRLLRPGFVDVL